VGTNYYWVTAPRHDSDYIEAEGPYLHICKLSGGWQPLFQGHPSDMGEDSAGMTIQSVEHWKTVMANDSLGRIKDEYGAVYTQKAFWKKIEDWRRIKKLQKHIPYMKKHHPTYLADYWVDSKGYEFDKRDFS
jgi:hypothetical protein